MGTEVFAPGKNILLEVRGIGKVFPVPLLAAKSADIAFPLTIQYLSTPGGLFFSPVPLSRSCQLLACSVSML